MTYEETVSFHGHECPGIAIGYRMACAAMAALESVRSEDEEIVAIVENDACGVDAVQCVTGCTFGKGNLVFRDYGKQVYTLYSRKSRKGVRVVFHGRGATDDVRRDRATYAKWLLQARIEDILSLTHVVVDEPEYAKIRTSVTCALCSESVMETRTRLLDGRTVCIPCAEHHASQRSSETNHQ